jgi:hypothetical protein
MESFGMLYDNMRNRHKKTDLHCHVKKKSSIVKLYVNEFRAVILTVLVVVSALTMQRTISEFLETRVRNHFKNTKTQSLWMFFFSLILIMLTILFVFLWKPLTVEEESAEEETSKQSV